MKRTPLVASFLCAAAALGLLGLHFNGEALPGWTPGLAALAAFFALPGALLAAFALSPRGWTSVRHWPGQVAFALNALLALAFLLYASPE